MRASERLAEAQAKPPGKCLGQPQLRRASAETELGSPMTAQWERVSGHGRVRKTGPLTPPLLAARRHRPGPATCGSRGSASPSSSPRCAVSSGDQSELAETPSDHISLLRSTPAGVFSVSRGAGATTRDVSLRAELAVYAPRPLPRGPRGSRAPQTHPTRLCALHVLLIQLVR